MRAVRRKPPIDVRRMNNYEMELARGTSYIASMLYEETIRGAVRETVLLFEACHGRDDLKAFAHALLGSLEERRKLGAVRLLQRFIDSGRLPEQTSSAPTRPVSTRNSVAQNLRGIQSPKTKARERAKIP